MLIKSITKGKGKRTIDPLERVDEKFVHSDSEISERSNDQLPYHLAIQAMMTMTIRVIVHLVARDVEVDMVRCNMTHSPRVMVGSSMSHNSLMHHRI